MTSRHAISALVATVALHSPLAAEPRPEVAETRRDLGVVSIGSSAEAGFAIRNDGDEPLEIVSVEVTPPCEAGQVASPIAPGSAAELAVRLPSVDTVGAITCTATVTTNAGGDPIVLTVEAAGKPLLAAHPGYARYSFVQGEAEGTIRQVIWATDGQPFSVLSVDGPEELKIAYREARPEERRPQPGSQWVVETTIPTWVPVGHFNGPLRVTTDHPVQKAIEIPVSGFVRPIVAVTPPVASAPQMPIGSKAKLFVKNFGTTPIQLGPVTSTVPALDPKVIEIIPGHQWEIELTLAAAAQPGAFAGEIRIGTDREEVGTVTVPITGNAIAPGE